MPESENPSISIPATTGVLAEVTDPPYSPTQKREEPDFETVWRERRSFRAEGVDIPVARLRHLVESKAAAGRPKDRLFLATHEEALRDLLRREP